MGNRSSEVEYLPLITMNIQKQGDGYLKALINGKMRQFSFEEGMEEKLMQQLKKVNALELLVHRDRIYGFSIGENVFCSPKLFPTSQGWRV